MEAKPSSKKALVILLVLIIVVLVVGILGYFAYTLILKNQPSQSTVDVRINVVDPSGIEVKEVESLELWVKGEGFEEFGKSIDVEERELSITVPSGFNREFEASAKVADKLYSATKTVDLEPNTRVVVEIKIEVTELGEVAEETTVPKETVPSGETSAVSTTTTTEEQTTTTEELTTTTEEHTVNLGVVGTETGTVSDVPTTPTATSVVGTGDLPDNTLVKGFASFDISSLAGTSVQSATIRMSSGTLYGAPAFMGNLELRAADYGTLDAGDFGRPGAFMAAYPAPTTSITYSSPPLVDALQALIDAGRSRAQLMIVYHDLHTDGHSDSDGVAFLPANISLEVTYIVP
jgi:hypothetical protein